MSARARWFTEDLPPVAPEDEPESEPPQRIEEVGEPVSVADPEQLEAKILHLLDAEKRFDAMGVTCSIKDRDESCCAVCPLRETLTGRHRDLCELGIEQERVATARAIARSRASHD